jgi:Domain of unknown function (DUF1996)
MARHQMPQRTKRRLIAAGIVATTIIGTGVVIGISGFASAHRRGGPDLSVLECIADDANPSSSAPPSSQTAPPQQSSTAPADPSGEVPPEQPPAEEPPAEQPPADEPPAEQPPAEQPPAEQPPAEQPPAEQPAEPAPAKPAWNSSAGLVAPAAAQPDSSTPNKPAPPPDNAPDNAEEAGSPGAATPAPQPQAEVQQFTKPSCTDALGPFPQDFVDITKVQPSNLNVRARRGASTGTFTVRCGTNAGRPHSNSDNVIVAPGTVNGAHHTHDYVGNKDTSQASTNDSLAAAGTTCSNGDQSTYYWPVIRLRNRDGGGTPGEVAANPHNIGDIITPTSASIQFRGSPVSKVVAMPRFLRIITGDAKASINGGANANVKWTCTGFRDRVTTKYPLCPRGSRVQIISDFQSCWDGQNIDSANHRTHVAFPDKNTGACAAGFKAIPQLRITLTYDVPRGRIFAVDAFPEVQHNPLTHHNDFINVMSDQLMKRAVDSINSGRRG